MKDSPSGRTATLPVLVARCRQVGMKITPQRLAIYHALAAATDHPTPETIYSRVRVTMPSLSLATIYKTLDALARRGLAVEVPTTGHHKRYDANTDRHHHLICVRCNRVTDYYDRALDRLPSPPVVGGFTPYRLSVHVYGLCGDCARERTTARAPRQGRPEGQRQVQGGQDGLGAEMRFHGPPDRAPTPPRRAR